MAFFSRSKAHSFFGRSEVMAGRPEQLPYLRQEQTPEGSMRITVRLGRPKWQRWLGGEGEVTRTFSLDCLGREVYHACDGKTSVSRIISEFAERHKISLAEAEMSVTAFLKTLLMKGLIAMAVEQNKK